MFTIRTETNWDCCQTEKPGLSGTENPDFTRPQSQKCQVGMLQVDFSTILPAKVPFSNFTLPLTVTIEREPCFPKWACYQIQCAISSWYLWSQQIYLWLAMCLIFTGCRFTPIGLSQIIRCKMSPRKLVILSAIRRPTYKTTVAPNIYITTCYVPILITE